MSWKIHLRTQNDFKLRANSLVLLFILICTHSVAQAELEVQIRAVMLGQLPSFVKWPKQAKHPATSNHFDLCVMGNHPFGNILDEIYSTKQIKAKPVHIYYINKISEADNCHLLFISSSNKRELADIVDYAQNNSILTVSETKGFSDQGVIINFYISKQKNKIAINNTSANNSSLKISSKLLSISRIIDPQ